MRTGFLLFSLLINFSSQAHYRCNVSGIWKGDRYTALGNLRTIFIVTNNQTATLYGSNYAQYGSDTFSQYRLLGYSNFNMQHNTENTSQFIFKSAYEDLESPNKYSIVIDKGPDGIVGHVNVNFNAFKDRYAFGKFSCEEVEFSVQ